MPRACGAGRQDVLLFRHCGACVSTCLPQCREAANWHEPFRLQTALFFLGQHCHACTETEQARQPRASHWPPRWSLGHNHRQPPQVVRSSARRPTTRSTDRYYCTTFGTRSQESARSYACRVKSEVQGRAALLHVQRLSLICSIIPQLLFVLVI